MARHSFLQLPSALRSGASKSITRRRAVTRLPASAPVAQVIGRRCEAVQRVVAAQVLRPLQQGQLDLVFGNEVGHQINSATSRRRAATRGSCSFSIAAARPCAVNCGLRQRARIALIDLSAAIGFRSS